MTSPLLYGTFKEMITHFIVHSSFTTIKKLRDNYHGYTHSVKSYKAMFAGFIVPSPRFLRFCMGRPELALCARYK